MADPRTLFEVELLKAVEGSNITKVRKLLNSSKISKSKLNDERYFDYDLIVKALSKHQIPLVKLLIEKGFRVYKESEVEKTILEYAVRLGDTDLIEAVLAKGGSLDILTTNKQKKTLFHVAINNKQLSTIDLFLSHFDNVEMLNEKNLLHHAVEKQNIQIIEKLVEKGLSVTKKNNNNFTPFCLVLKTPWKNHQFEALDSLLSHFTVENNKLDNSDNTTPAYIACISGNLQLLKKYVDSDLSINTPLECNTDSWPCLDDYSGYTLLHCAVEHMKLDIVEFLLSKGADICVEDKNGSTPLHIAFEKKEKGIWATWQDFENNNSIIDLMLNASLKSKSIPTNKNGLSHFHIACSTDNYKVVEHFLIIGALINQPVSAESYPYKQFSPLHYAVKFRCVKTLELLLKKGVDVRQRDSKKRTALHIAAEEFCEDGVHLLLQYGADVTSTDSDDNTPLHLAFKQKNYAIIDVLLTAHYENHSNPVNAERVSHFHIACARNNVNIVRSFIESGASVDSCVPTLFDKKKTCYVSCWSGYSPLHFAVYHNRSKNVKLLLESGANVGVKCSKGFTPLNLVCQYNFEMFREFVKNTLCDLSKKGEVVLQVNPITDIFKVSEKYFNGFSGTIGKICWTSHRAEHLEIINSLMNFKSDVNCMDNRGNTPVFYACAAGKRSNCESDNDLHCAKALWSKISRDLFGELKERSGLICNKLLSVKVNLDKCYKNGSILHYICTRYDDWAAKMVKVFLDKGANVNATNNEMLTPLHVALLTGNSNKKLIRTLLDFDANVDCVNPEDHSTPLLIAAEGTKPMPNIKILIGKGANVNAKRSNGTTALHSLVTRHHCRKNDVDAAIYALLKAGANINCRDSDGFTPLHLACLVNNEKLVRQLLELGADINVENNEGKSVCCYLYEELLENPSLEDRDMYHRNRNIFSSDSSRSLASALECHIIKMNAIGLSLSKKVLKFYVKCKKCPLLTDQEKQEFTNKCNGEVLILQDTKINSHSTLYNAIFKDENTLSQMVKNDTFKSIIQSTSFEKNFPVYGALIQLKYQEGVDRANLLPTAARILNKLAERQLPDACTEHICKYFANFELKECTKTLSCFLDCNAKKLDDNKTTVKSRRANKRQKVR